jgi:molybdenum cofactor guanylyltransferase
VLCGLFRNSGAGRKAHDLQYTRTVVNRHGHVAGFILAGGASSRMGRDKGLLDFDGAPLILHTARLLEPLVSAVTVVGSPAHYKKLGLDVISDSNRFKSGNDGRGFGPLAGIAAALAATHSRWNLIVACDLPYLSAEWLDWLLSRALRSSAVAVVPRTGRGIEPLAAMYRRECCGPIAAALARGERKVSSVVEELRPDFVQPGEWRRIEPNERVLKNMNAPADYEEARIWWAAKSPKAIEEVSAPRPGPKRKRRSAPRRSK